MTPSLTPKLAKLRDVNDTGLVAGDVLKFDGTVFSRVAVGTAANNIPQLDGSGKLPSGVLPPLAITSTTTVANQAAMLALTAENGDVAIRTDFTPRRAFILTSNSPSTLADWVQLNDGTGIALLAGGNVFTGENRWNYDPTGVNTSHFKMVRNIYGAGEFGIFEVSLEDTTGDMFGGCNLLMSPEEGIAFTQGNCSLLVKQGIGISGRGDILFYPEPTAENPSNLNIYYQLIDTGGQGVFQLNLQDTSTNEYPPATIYATPEEGVVLSHGGSSVNVNAATGLVSNNNITSYGTGYFAEGLGTTPLNADYITEGSLSLDAIPFGVAFVASVNTWTNTNAATGAWTFYSSAPIYLLDSGDNPAGELKWNSFVMNAGTIPGNATTPVHQLTVTYDHAAGVARPSSRTITNSGTSASSIQVDYVNVIGAGGSGTDYFVFWQFGGADRYSVDTGGNVLASGLVSAGTGLKLTNAGEIEWSSNSSVATAADTGIKRNAAGVVEINNGTPGTLRDITLRDIVATGDYKGPNNREISIDRTVPTTVGSAVDLGTYTATNGGSMMEVTIVIATVGYAQVKKYFFPTAYAASTSWTKLEAFASTGPYIGNDANLEVQIVTNGIALRLRRASGTDAGVAKIGIVYHGYVSSDTWTPSTTVNAVSAPTNRYPVYGDAFLGDVVVAGRSVPVAGGSYSVFNYNGTGNPVRLVSWSNTANGGASPAAPEVAQTYARQGVNSVAYDNYAEVKIGRWENSGATARTMLSWALTHGNGDATGTDIMSLYSDGRLRQHVAAPPATASAAGIAGQFTFGDLGGTKYLFYCVSTNTWVRVAMATW